MILLNFLIIYRIIMICSPQSSSRASRSRSNSCASCQRQLPSDQRGLQCVKCYKHICDGCQKIHNKSTSRCLKCFSPISVAGRASPHSDEEDELPSEKPTDSPISQPTGSPTASDEIPPSFSDDDDDDAAADESPLLVTAAEGDADAAPAAAEEAAVDSQKTAAENEAAAAEEAAEGNAASTLSPVTPSACSDDARGY